MVRYYEGTVLRRAQHKKRFHRDSKQKKEYIPSKLLFVQNLTLGEVPLFIHKVGRRTNCCTAARKHIIHVNNEMCK